MDVLVAMNWAKKRRRGMLHDRRVKRSILTGIHENRKTGKAEAHTHSFLYFMSSCIPVKNLRSILTLQILLPFLASTSRFMRSLLKDQFGLPFCVRLNRSFDQLGMTECFLRDYFRNRYSDGPTPWRRWKVRIRWRAE